MKKFYDTAEVVTLNELVHQRTSVHMLDAGEWGERGVYANFRQPRQKLTLCTALLSPEASRCTGQLRCQTTSDELRVVRGFAHRVLPTCGLPHFAVNNLPPFRLSDNLS